ncbi:MAG: hypothetical protein K8F91_21025 [Candidatus Obscuribacterales bacterium]|nr:hypothetical protein [Candidatus Obscuribacterales bacterium]
MNAHTTRNDTYNQALADRYPAALAVLSIALLLLILIIDTNGANLKNQSLNRFQSITAPPMPGLAAPAATPQSQWYLAPTGERLKILPAMAGLPT